MWNHKRTRRWRSCGIIMAILGVAAGFGQWLAITGHLEIVADFLSACVVSCLTLCVPFLLSPVSNPPETDVDGGLDDIVEKCKTCLNGVLKA